MSMQGCCRTRMYWSGWSCQSCSSIMWWELGLWLPMSGTPQEELAWDGQARRKTIFFKMVRWKWFLNGGFILVCLSIEIFVLCQITLAYVWHVGSSIWKIPAALAVRGVHIPLVGPIGGHSKRPSQITQNLFLLWKMQDTLVDNGICDFFIL